MAKFKVFNAFSGRENEMSDLIAVKLKYSFLDYRTPEQIAFIPCFSLNTIMRALNRTRVDYFSLDVEGGELTVLKSFDFENLDIRSFSIEWAKTPLIKELLKAKNYDLRYEDKIDLYYTKI